MAQTQPATSGTQQQTVGYLTIYRYFLAKSELYYSLVNCVNLFGGSYLP